METPEIEHRRSRRLGRLTDRAKQISMNQLQLTASRLEATGAVAILESH